MFFFCIKNIIFLDEFLWTKLWHLIEIYLEELLLSRMIFDEMNLAMKQ
jgi:hypothetical protein